MRGAKRQAETNQEEDNYEKKMCLSLDLSGTCGRLGEIEIRSSSSDCSNLRCSSDTDSIVDVSLQETMGYLMYSYMRQMQS